MDNSHKRPLTTYSRKSNSAAAAAAPLMSAAAALDPDAALQEKIRSVLGGEKDAAAANPGKKRFPDVAEEDFDSAYIENNVS